ncbi:heterokaryon incompatibility protein [Colletotrichum truncatum]|uniref:Heterokaryon incompatibility protein n=1 Tax=Colletotrichum truncatum TaxID=5467 RepID=A0ACC3ZL38_COLTU|nr:heterokaryon incompatibility protein [Colletotrichum truncatum]KAF6786911.1 heterokaryon incompatibility protein [Colletotrichum truncatum]
MALEKFSAVYHQLPLTDGDRYIRVLILHPGLRGSPISASMRLLSLGDGQNQEPYATLSYTWGDPAVKKPIILEHELFDVTINLYNALQHIRSPSRQIQIWVDALCINQQDIKERSSQVSLMNEVYELCEKVYIWLGCPDDDDAVTSNPFAIVEHFRDNQHFFSLPGYAWDRSRNQWICDTENPQFKLMWDSFSPVAESPWWTRAWTAQETILPSEALVMYGDWSISWTDIVTCRFNRVRHLNDYSGTCCGHAYEAVGRERIMPLDSVMGSVMIMESIRRKTGYIRSFSDVTRVFADRHCKDPRDKVYSLLSFVKGHEKSFLPDYEKSVADVYIEAFKYMLAEVDMSPFCLLGQGFNSTTCMGLPSWVRDFSKPLETKHQIRRAFEAYPLFNACGGRTGKAVVLDDNKLGLTGIQVDSVKDKSSISMTSASTDSCLQDCISDWVRTATMNGIMVSTKTVDQRFARVLCGGVIDGRDGPKGSWRLLEQDDHDLPDSTEWEDFLSGVGRALPRKYRVGMGTATDGQAFYVTQKGRMGLSSPDLEIDDEIWCIEGSKVPFILRRTDNPDFHRLIGDTYLEDVMHRQDKDGCVDGLPVVLV